MLINFTLVLFSCVPFDFIEMSLNTFKLRHTVSILARIVFANGQLFYGAKKSTHKVLIKEYATYTFRLGVEVTSIHCIGIRW